MSDKILNQCLDFIKNMTPEEFQEYEKSLEPFVINETDDDYIGIEEPQYESKLKKILSMKDNWNGYGAKAFTKEHIDLARKFIKQLFICPEVYPTAADSIQVEYTYRDEYVEFEVYPDGTIKMYVEKEGATQ